MFCINFGGVFMYNSQDIANRIKDLAKLKKKSMKNMLSDCELGINTISKMSKGTDILSKNLAKIADHLDCSVDYLLGRTDQINSSTETITDDDIKFALFGGDGKITDEMFNEVKTFAQFVKNKYKKDD